MDTKELRNLITCADTSVIRDQGGHGVASTIQHITQTIATCSTMYAASHAARLISLISSNSDLGIKAARMARCIDGTWMGWVGTGWNGLGSEFFFCHSHSTFDLNLQSILMVLGQRVNKQWPTAKGRFSAFFSVLVSHAYRVASRLDLGTGKAHHRVHRGQSIG